MRRRYERNYTRRSNGLTQIEMGTFSYIHRQLFEFAVRKPRAFLDAFNERARKIESDYHFNEKMDEDLAIAYFKVMNDIIKSL